MPFFGHGENKEKEGLKEEKHIAKSSRTKPNELIENQARLIKRMSELEVKITRTVLKLQQATSKDDKIFYTKLLKEYDKRRGYYDSINKIYLKRISELNIDNEGELTKSSNVNNKNSIDEIDIVDKINPDDVNDIDTDLIEGNTDISKKSNSLDEINFEITMKDSSTLNSSSNSSSPYIKGGDKNKKSHSKNKTSLSNCKISSPNIEIANCLNEDTNDSLSTIPMLSSDDILESPSTRQISEEELTKIINDAVEGINKMEDFERVVALQRQIEIVTYPPLPKHRLEMIHKLTHLPNISISDVDSILTKQFVPDQNSCKKTLQKDLVGVVSALMPPPIQMDREPIYLTCGVCSKQ